MTLALQQPPNGSYFQIVQLWREAWKAFRFAFSLKELNSGKIHKFSGSTLKIISKVGDFYNLECACILPVFLFLSKYLSILIQECLSFFTDYCNIIFSVASNYTSRTAGAFIQIYAHFKLVRVVVFSCFASLDSKNMLIQTFSFFLIKIVGVLGVGCIMPIFKMMAFFMDFSRV